MRIIITGTSSGIGEGLAEFYCKRGHDVAGISRRQSKRLRIFDNYTEFNVDLADFNKAGEFFFDYFEEVKETDMLILNSGILGRIERFEKQSMEDVYKVMDINVWANKIILDNVVKTSFKVGQVVAISSGAAKNGSAGWGPYSVSKAALNMLIKTYAAENPHIHFSAVAPGLVDTKMQEYISSLKSTEEFPAIERLQKARGTEAMPGPLQAADILDKAFAKVRTMESGIFVDVREL